MNAYEIISSDMAARLGLKRMALILLAGSFATNWVLACALLLKSDPVTTVLVPLGINETTHPITVSNHHVDAEYLTLVSRDLLSMAMNVTPSNVDFNREMLLKHVTPSAFGEIDEALKEKAKLIKRLHASSLFSIESLAVNPATLMVTARGFKHHYIGKTETLKQKTAVSLRFSLIAGKLQLVSLAEVDDSKNKKKSSPDSI